jgi:hypothetical protein
VELVVAAVEHTGLHRRIRFWKGRPAGFDCAPALEIAANTLYTVRLRPEHLLSPPASAALVDLTVDLPLPLHVSVTFRAARAGALHGIAGWFVARLSAHVTMTNSPLSAERMFRRQVFFPIGEPVPIGAGTTIDVSMRILPADSMYTWAVCVEPPGGPPVTFQHTTLRGMLLGREDLARTNPAHRPTLTRPGLARLSVLPSATVATRLPRSNVPSTRSSAICSTRRPRPRYSWPQSSRATVSEGGDTQSGQSTVTVTGDSHRGEYSCHSGRKCNTGLEPASEHASTGEARRQCIPAGHHIVLRPGTLKGACPG